MKLNLLPTYVSKEKQGRFAVLGSVILAAAGLAAMLFLIRSSRDAVQVEQNRINAAKPDADTAVAISKQADDVMNQARGLILNMNLADAMNTHSKEYPDLYDEVRQYIPSFYRISSLNAVPNGAESVTVTMTGYLSTFQQYADLMVALLRIPGATAVSRSGFQLTDPLVPNLVPEDQTARPFKPGDPRIPDDPMDRLDLQIANAQLTGFQGAGGFGTTNRPIVRGAMPTQSTVTVAVVIAGKDLQTPDPRATLAQASSLWGAPAATPASGTAPAATNPAPGTARPGTPPTTSNRPTTPPTSAGRDNAPPAAKAGGPNRKNPAPEGDEE
jgi:hypothetical protein